VPRPRWPEPILKSTPPPPKPRHWSLQSLVLFTVPLPIRIYPIAMMRPSDEHSVSFPPDLVTHYWHPSLPRDLPPQVLVSIECIRWVTFCVINGQISLNFWISQKKPIFVGKMIGIHHSPQETGYSDKNLLFQDYHTDRKNWIYRITPQYFSRWSTFGFFQSFIITVRPFNHRNNVERRR
jgi:hypothetical protein